MLNFPPPDPEKGEIAISLERVDKWYGDFHVLKAINLEVRPGEKIVICGPSGSGKSTLIRCINGLEPHEKGRIVVDGTELTRDLRHLQKIRSEAGMVFQSFNLFPHLTVLENLCLAPDMGEAHAEGRGGGTGDGPARARAHQGAGAQISGTAFRRAAAARRHRAGARR